MHGVSTKYTSNTAKAMRNACNHSIPRVYFRITYCRMSGVR